MQCACACVHVYVRGLHALEDLLGVDFRPCTRHQRADAPAFAHQLIITHVRAHMLNDTRCNTCVCVQMAYMMLCAHGNLMQVLYNVYNGGRFSPFRASPTRGKRAGSARGCRGYWGPPRASRGAAGMGACGTASNRQHRCPVFGAGGIVSNRAVDTRGDSWRTTRKRRAAQQQGCTERRCHAHRVPVRPSKLRQCVVAPRRRGNTLMSGQLVPSAENQSFCMRRAL